MSSFLRTAGTVISLGAALLSADNLLINGSFEEGAAGWQQWGAVSTEHSYTGAKAMQVVNSENTWSGISQEVPILEGTTSITISGWMKTDNVKAGQEMWEQAQIAVEFLDANGIPYEYYPTQTALETGTQEWTYYEKNYGVYPDAKRIKIVAALGNATGSASFDQFSLIQHKGDGSVQDLSDLKAYHQGEQQTQSEAHSLLPNGDFEEGKKGWQVFKCSFPEEGQDGGKAMLVSNTTSEWAGASQSMAIPKEATRFVISGWMKTENVVRGKEGWDKALFNFEFQNKIEERVGDFPEAIAQVEGTTEWTYFQQSYGVNEKASHIKLFCQLCNASGKVWFDDIKVVYYNASNEVIQ